jgi:branched-chain amino acid transport system ATP-binding protein
MVEMDHIQSGREVRRGDPIIEVRDVCVFYGQAPALKDVSLSVPEGGVVAVLGSNGAGKTTLLRTVTGLLAPRSGDIVFKGAAIEGRHPSKIIRMGVASVPEGGELFSTMHVYDNLLLGAYPLNRHERKEKLPARLDMVFHTFPVLQTRLNQKAETLSGGERQMLALARALMSGPTLIALDEPSLGLSPLLVIEMMRLLNQIRQEMGMSIMLVEQNAKAALRIADYAYILERGEVVLKGESEEIAANPAVYSAYLGA